MKEISLPSLHPEFPPPPAGPGASREGKVWIPPRAALGRDDPEDILGRFLIFFFFFGDGRIRIWNSGMEQGKGGSSARLDFFFFFTEFFTDSDGIF